MSSIDQTTLDTRLSQLKIELSCTPIRAGAFDSAIKLGKEALSLGRAELAVELLDMVVALQPRHAGAWQLLGFACGAEQLIARATQAFARAVELEPHNMRSILAHCRATFDSGKPAAALYERAHKLAPNDLGVIDGWAAALAAQGDEESGERLLAEILLREPQWIAGHKRLSAMRYTSGDALTFARSYVVACDQLPANLPLRMAWYGEAMRSRQWDLALHIIREGERRLGAAPHFFAARAVLAGESGERALAAELFAQTSAMADDALKIAHVRHCLRTSQFEKAECIALQVLQGTSAPLIWPYLSLVWRLTGNPLAQWLDGSPPYIETFDLGYSSEQLRRLAGMLRSLHQAHSPFADQSVRGGTQTHTDQQLFFRAEPEIMELRRRVTEAVSEYCTALPPPLAGHPLLGAPRSKILFSGSWSVRLRAQGFHVSHSHPRGWISSAFYVELPDADRLGVPPAGWIRFGLPPQDLGLDLPAYGMVQPKPGRLVLFPSTMWHETLPFGDGERLVVAFDVMHRR